MLGKLIKHEFRATARIMLPMLSAVLVLGILLGLFVLGQQSSNVGALNILLGVVIFLMVAAVVASAVMSIVLMVYRFYRNLLGDEGYLMFSLPVSVDALVWSKLIVSTVWFLATGLAIFLSVSLAGLIMGFSDLKVVLANLPTWKQIHLMLMQVGLRPADIWLFLLEMMLGVLVSALVTCLHFYAAMSLGQMFSDHKGLFSVLFFFGISIAVQIIMSMLGTAGFSVLQVFDSLNVETPREFMSFFHGLMGSAILLSAAEGVALYFVTTITLKKRLNLA